MGFSLAGFGAGLAEGVYERIEEERKFSNAALQGRLERASVLKMQQEKEAAALEKELIERKRELVQLGVEDPELMKAYLFSPVAFEALKKARMSTEDNIRNLSPKDIITPNATKIAQMTGTVDDLISNAVRSRTQVEPAKLLEPQGRSWLSPSAGQMQRRLEQTAAARGMTLEDVARAESGFRPSMPEPTATVNFGVFKKEDKSTNEQRQAILDRNATEAIVKFGEESKEAKEAQAAAANWRKATEKVEPKQAQDPDKMQKGLEAAALAAEQQFGKNSPEAIAAASKFSNFVVARKNLTPEQMDHAKMMSRAQYILFNPKANVTPEERETYTTYYKNYQAEQRRLAAEGKSNDKIPNEPSLINILRSGSTNVIRSKYPTFAPDGKTRLIFEKNKDGTEGYTVAERNPEIEQRLFVEQNQAVIEVARQAGYIDRDYRVTDNKVRGALSAFGIFLDENGKVKVPETTKSDSSSSKSSSQTKVPPVPARTMTPTEAADDFASIGAPAGAAPRPAPAPAKPAAAPAQDKFVVGKEYIDAAGNRAVYRGNGKWESVTR
jgi:hypothetical protein